MKRIIAISLAALAVAGCGGHVTVAGNDLDKTTLQNDVVKEYNSTSGATATGADCTITGHDAHCMVQTAVGMQVAYDLVINANGDGFSQSNP